MTMFSAKNRQYYYGGYGSGYREGFCIMSTHIEGGDDDDHDNCLGSNDHDLDVTGPSIMADDIDQSRNVEEKAESSSKEVQEEEKDEGWLQLSIGGGNNNSSQQYMKKDDTKKRSSSLIELELLPSNSNYNNNNNSSGSHLPTRPLGNMPEFRAPRQVMNFASPSFFLQHGGSSNTSNFPQHQEINWGFRPIPISVAAPSSSPLMGPNPYFSRPFQLYTGLDMGPGPGIDFRVIPPPRRPHSGLWFMLQASQNQEKEPFLPQISKSYLRIKDGRMTIRLVIKYLLNKLRLENESEIEMRCKGQRLQPFLTLQHVRDNIWSSPRDFITLLPNSSTTDHIMVLHYARTTSTPN